MTLMAVKAQASITIFYVNEVEAVYRYYLLQSSTLAKPSAPTSYPPPAASITWDGDTTGRESCMSQTMYKVSDVTSVTTDDLIGQSFSLYDSTANETETVVITPDDILIESIDGLDVIAVLYNGFPFIIICNSEIDVDGDGKVELGVYFISFSAVGSNDYVYELTIPGGWSPSEPTYSEGSTTSLYYVDCTILTDGTWSYSPVSLSSSYEAAKLAYNKALAAEGRVVEAESSIEKLDEQITLRVTKTDLETTVTNVNADLSDIQSDLDNTYKVVTENSTKISELLQTASGWTMSFNTLNTTVTELNGRLNTEVSDRYEYIRFVDGDIYLGKRPEAGEDDLQLVISNEKISFTLNGNEVAYFSDDSLYVTTIYVTRALRFGSFEFAERSNGNMGLRWVGES